MEEPSQRRRQQVEPVTQERGVMTSGPIVIAGMAQRRVCGVRDHSRVLAASVSQLGLSPYLVWEDMPEHPSRQAVQRAARSVASRISEQDNAPRAIILEYSVFNFAYRGIPVGVSFVAAALQHARCPVLLYLHEYAYPWSGGLRGWTWAVTQRRALRSLVNAADAVAVTTERRRDELRRCRWLARRPVVVAPASTTLPFPISLTAGAWRATRGRRATIGVIGYGAESSRPGPLLEAISRVDPDGDLEVLLLGAPGPESSGARHWQDVARHAGLRQSLVFTGILSADALVGAIGNCTVLAFTDSAGADGRRTSVAAGLSLGVPVIAFDGPQFWVSLAESQAVVRVAPHPAAIAPELVRFIEGGTAVRQTQALRGREFFDSELEPSMVARRVLRAVGLAETLT